MSVRSRRLLTTREVADLLVLKPKTLANWRCAGKGPRWIRIGGAVRYRHADLEAWLAEQQEN